MRNTSSAPTRIGIAVVVYDGRFLVGVRGEEGPLPGYAEFPGGKCHPNESPAACAIRECHEETGLRVDIARPLLSREYEYPHGTVDLYFFLCTPADGSDVSNIGGGFRWADTQELRALKFPPANEPVIDRLIDRRSDNGPSGSDVA